MVTAFSMNLFFCDSSATQEVLVYLLIKLFSVGNYQKRVIALKFPKYFLGKENHGEAFTPPLRMPENPEPPKVLFYPFEGLNNIVHTKILMVFGDYLVYCSSRVLIKDEVFQDVQ